VCPKNFAILATRLLLINFNYIINENNYKVIKPLHINPVTSGNEILTKINIEPKKFLADFQDPLKHTNNK